MTTILEKYSSIPATRKAVSELQAGQALLRLGATDPTAVTDSTTGNDAGPMKAIKLQRTTFSHVGGETDLALASSFGTAQTAANNGINSLLLLINEIATPLGIGVLTAGDGAAGVLGTIPAQTKAITGTAGDTAVAVDRKKANDALANIRNNVSTLILGYNRIASALGASLIMDVGEGAASVSLTVANKTDLGAPVASSGDAMSKAHADTQFAANADNMAYLAARIDALQTYVEDNAFPAP